MGLDLERVRADTPGRVETAFFDSAGSSLPPRPVLETVLAHLRREAQVGGYRAAGERADDLADVKIALGALIGVPPASVALSDSATRAWSDFFYAVPLRAGDRIAVSHIDYATNAVATLQRARAVGAEIVVLPSDAQGRTDVEAVDAVLDERVALVSLVHVPTQSGLVEPIAAIAAKARAVGARVLLDACQSIGQIPVDAAALGVDAISGTGRKWLRGPRGTGFLHVREELLSTLEPRSLDLHSAQWTSTDTYELAQDARRFETWECDVAARLGLGHAVRYLLDLGPEQVFAELSRRAAAIREALAELPGVTVRDPDDGPVGAIVTLTIDGVDPVAARAELAARGVTVGASSASSARRDLGARALPAVLRISAHAFVNDEDTDRLLTELAALARRAGAH
ncbi:aminotransferase class V [Tsukamurella pulmonis]|uniref:aminotransferase class V-fold PLP-dependent enzyme n=1 Tax=Tsukamurella pulmonis TaxID=47312 RepID=UPI00079112C3|nr:aminotransferase class V-fold PLP-dependent enzyme [Tsukamurella pulmonis]KXP08349.1 aminotransferase class V [Tsukamurella pulmonis]RDH12442.1 aminotransferase class V-fold PLP-dependent enzyme [Tsukamurella pulmonis]